MKNYKSRLEQVRATRSKYWTGKGPAPWEDGEDDLTPFTFQIIAATFCACQDYINGNRMSFEQVSDYANDAYQNAFGVDDLVTRQLFINSYTHIYGHTIKLILNKTPIVLDLIKKMQRASHDETHTLVWSFCHELLRTNTFHHYYRDIVPDKETVHEMISTAAYLRFCLDKHERKLQLQQAELEAFALLVLSCLVYVEKEEDRKEIINAVQDIYTVLEILYQANPKTERMVEIVTTSSTDLRNGIKKGLLFMYQNLLPDLSEIARKELESIFFSTKQFSSNGILPHLSEEEPECVIVGCTERPGIIADIQVTFTNEMELVHVYCCADHVERVRREFGKDQAEQIAVQLAEFMETQVTKPPIITFRKTNDEKRKHVSKISQLIERYRYHQVADEGHDGLLLAQAVAGERGRLFFQHFVSGYTDLAHKKELAPTGLALLSTLPKLSMDGMTQYVLGLPLMWISFEEPLETRVGEIHGICWGTATQEMFDRAQKKYPLSSKQVTEMREVLLQPSVPWKSIGMDFVNEFGETIWSISSFLVPDGSGGYGYRFIQNQCYVLCDNPACKQSGNAPCPKCIELIEENLSIFVNILRIRAGEFAVSTPPPIHKTRNQTVVRKEVNPEKMHKYLETTYQYQYEIITINGLTLRSPDPKKPGYTIGSWMSRLDPNQIIIVPENIDLRTRRLRDQIYWPMIRAHGIDPEAPDFKGYPILVKPHTRNRPVKVETLMKRQEKVERIIAE